MRPPLAGAGDVAAGLVGIYRGRFERADGESRRFQLMLFVARPDRLHAELVGPLGSAQMIVDGGGGRLALTVVGDRVAYVGAARPEHLARILGIASSLEDLVRAVLDGVAVDSRYTIVRSAEPEGVLPAELELRSEELLLRMELQKRRALGSPAGALGTGEPPVGVERRPLEQLWAADDPALFRGADSP